MSADLRIELATEAEVPRILDISNWAAAHTTANFATAPEPLEQWLEMWRATSATHPWLVARDENGDVGGFARAMPHKARQAYAWSVDVSVYLAPELHGRGVGTSLYHALLELLRAQGFVTAIAGITAGHLASERLHAKLGFTRCATFARVGWKLNQWHDVGYWQLHLHPADHPPAPLLSVEAARSAVHRHAENSKR